jgi:hypothetical protein
MENTDSIVMKNNKPDGAGDSVSIPLSGEHVNKEASGKIDESIMKATGQIASVKQLIPSRYSVKTTPEPPRPAVNTSVFSPRAEPSHFTAYHESSLVQNHSTPPLAFYQPQHAHLPETREIHTPHKQTHQVENTPEPDSDYKSNTSSPEKNEQKNKDGVVKVKKNKNYLEQKKQPGSKKNISLNKTSNSKHTTAKEKEIRLENALALKNSIRSLELNKAVLRNNLYFYLSQRNDSVREARQRSREARLEERSRNIDRKIQAVMFLKNLDEKEKDSNAETQK